MRNVFLYGHLKKTFGPRFRLDVNTPGEAIRLLAANFPKFERELRKGYYKLIVGPRAKGGQDLALEDVEFRLGRDDFHLVPVAEGRGKGGALKTILGVALVGAAIFFSGGTLAAPLAGMGGAAFGIGGATVSWGTLAGFGLIAALTGVSQMISPSTKAETGTKKEDSYSLSGPGNIDAQGYPVPVVIGELITGGIPVSVSYDVSDIPINYDPDAPTQVTTTSIGPGTTIFTQSAVRGI